jgi:hypothetical protein
MGARKVARKVKKAIDNAADVELDQLSPPSPILPPNDDPITAS